MIHLYNRLSTLRFITYSQFHHRMIKTSSKRYFVLLTLPVLSLLVHYSLKEHDVKELIEKLEGCKILSIIPNQSRHLTKVDEPVAEQIERTNILLLAYPRSGSSFLGDLLSAGETALYLFEPFKVLIPGSVEKQLDENMDGTVLQLQVKNYLEGMYDCDPMLLKVTSNKTLIRGGYFGLRKMGEDCLSSNPKVVKSIRIHSLALISWIHETNIKVVHLVRDPRGMVRSMTSLKDSFNNAEWGNYLAPNICRDFREDMGLEQALGPRYIRIRYEDVVENAEKVIKKLYDQLNIPFTDHVREFIYKQTHAEEGTNKRFETSRDEKFRHDVWKENLDMDQIKDIEGECKEVMEILNYPKYVYDQ